METDPKLIAFIISMAAMSFVLLWGIRRIAAALGDTGGTGKTLASELLSEKVVAKPAAGAAPVGAAGAAPEPPPASPQVGSFSRTAGAIGGMALAAAVIGIAYWVLYALFYEANLDKLEGLGTFFLSGSALFAPYAFNQLSSIFKAGS